MNAWTAPVDGTAIGPTGIIPMFDGDAEAQVLWDDERGIQITLQVTDFTMTAEEWVKLRSLVDQLFGTALPVTS